MKRSGIERKRRDWFYFKNIASVDISKQEDAALGEPEDGAPGPVPDQGNWLGESMYAQHRHCRDVTKLLYKRKFNNEMPPGDRPVADGDTLWVYSLLCLGAGVKRIRESIIKIHECGVHLKIYLLDVDKSVSGEERDYQLLIRALDQLDKPRQKPVVPPKPDLEGILDRNGKIGRRPRGINYYTLTDEGKRLIREHCRKKTPTFQILLEKIQDRRYLGDDIWGRPVNRIGEKRLRDIIRQYKEELEKRKE